MNQMYREKQDRRPKSVTSTAYESLILGTPEAEPHACPETVGETPQDPYHAFLFVLKLIHDHILSFTTQRDTQAVGSLSPIISH